MASGFFAILDDIAALMDDVAINSKIATRKTAGILGDDLAVNAEKATGFSASRELPVLWAITKGSFVNKLIILPIAFLLNWLFPIAIKVILVLGGIYLAYEGVEKIVEFFFHRKNKTNPNEEIKVTNSKGTDTEEKTKIKNAIFTDFILSIEIVIIALGTVLDKPLPEQILTVTIVAILATIGVYGIVAIIIRMDDVGNRLMNQQKNGGILFTIGQFLVKLLPWIIKFLSVVGTIALILVAGGIFSHNIPHSYNVLERYSIPVTIQEFILGLTGGLIALVLVQIFKSIFNKNKTH